MLQLHHTQNGCPMHVQMQSVKISPLMYVYDTPKLTTPCPNAVWRLKTVGRNRNLGSPSSGHSGQGNGVGPQIWVVVSTPILDLLGQEGYGAAFKVAVSSDYIQFVSYSFVNNMDLIQTGPTINSTVAKTLPLMQAALDLWNQGLSTTRGHYSQTNHFGTQ